MSYKAYVVAPMRPQDARSIEAACKASGGEGYVNGYDRLTKDNILDKGTLVMMITLDRSDPYEWIEEFDADFNGLFIRLEMFRTDIRGDGDAVCGAREITRKSFYRGLK